MPFDLKTAIATHHSFFHGRIAITHRPKNPPGVDNPNCFGLIGAVDKARLSLFGGTLSLEDLSCIIEVWGTGLTAGMVNNGDELIVADGTRYTILGRFWCDRTTRFECACLEITGDLQ